MQVSRDARCLNLTSHRERPTSSSACRAAECPTDRRRKRVSDYAKSGVRSELTTDETVNGGSNHANACVSRRPSSLNSQLLVRRRVLADCQLGRASPRLVSSRLVFHSLTVHHSSPCTLAFVARRDERRAVQCGRGSTTLGSAHRRARTAGDRRFAHRAPSPDVRPISTRAEGCSCTDGGAPRLPSKRSLLLRIHSINLTDAVRHSASHHGTHERVHGSATMSQLPACPR